MELDVLAILMVAFGLFAILMFILFYVYAKKTHNTKHMSDDYNVDESEEDVIVNNNINKETSNNINNITTKEVPNEQTLENNSDVTNQEVVMPEVDNSNDVVVPQEVNTEEKVEVAPQEVAINENIVVTPIDDTTNNMEPVTITPQEEVKVDSVVTPTNDLEVENNDLDEFIPKKKKI